MFQILDRKTEVERFTWIIILKMAAMRTDVFSPLLVLMIFITFMVNKQSFCQPDGISITLNKPDIFSGETFIYSSLYTSKIHRCLRPKSKSLLCLLLLLCGDVEQCPGPSYSGLAENVTRFCNTKGMKIFALNIRGLQGNFDELKNILITSKIDIFALNEIFINTEDDEIIDDSQSREIFISSYKTDNQFKVQGYDFIYKSRDKGSGGGVGIYIKENIDYKIRKDLENPEISICVEIKPKKSNSWIFSTMYKPPDSSKYLTKNFHSHLENILNLITSEQKETILMGDINVNYLLKEDHKEIKKLFTVNGFT